VSGRLLVSVPVYSVQHPTQHVIARRFLLCNCNQLLLHGDIIALQLTGDIIALHTHGIQAFIDKREKTVYNLHVV